MKTVKNIAGLFTGAVAALGLATSPALAQDENNSIAPRNTPSCGDLFRTSTGREVDASYSAHNYSQENVGKVGISIFAGQDLGEYSAEYLGTALVNSLRRRGVEAECFVHHEEMPNGTGINFHIAGLSYSNESLSITESLNAEVMDALAAEALTAGRVILAHNNQSPGTNR